MAKGIITNISQGIVVDPDRVGQVLSECFESSDNLEPTLEALAAIAAADAALVAGAASSGGAGTRGLASVASRAAAGQAGPGRLGVVARRAARQVAQQAVAARVEDFADDGSAGRLSARVARACALVSAPGADSRLGLGRRDARLVLRAAARLYVASLAAGAGGVASECGAALGSACASLTESGVVAHGWLCEAVGTAAAEAADAELRSIADQHGAWLAREAGLGAPEAGVGAWDAADGGAPGPAVRLAALLGVRPDALAAGVLSDRGAARVRGMAADRAASALLPFLARPPLGAAAARSVLAASVGGPVATGGGGGPWAGDTHFLEEWGAAVRQGTARHAEAAGCPPMPALARAAHDALDGDGRDHHSAAAHPPGGGAADVWASARWLQGAVGRPAGSRGPVARIRLSPAPPSLGSRSPQRLRGLLTGRESPADMLLLARARAGEAAGAADDAARFLRRASAALQDLDAAGAGATAEAVASAMREQRTAGAGAPPQPTAPSSRELIGVSPALVSELASLLLDQDQPATAADLLLRLAEPPLRVPAHPGLLLRLIRRCGHDDGGFGPAEAVSFAERAVAAGPPWAGLLPDVHVPALLSALLRRSCWAEAARVLELVRGTPGMEPGGRAVAVVVAALARRGAAAADADRGRDDDDAAALLAGAAAATAELRRPCTAGAGAPDASTVAALASLALARAQARGDEAAGAREEDGAAGAVLVAAAGAVRSAAALRPVLARCVAAADLVAAGEDVGAVTASAASVLEVVGFGAELGLAPATPPTQRAEAAAAQSTLTPPEAAGGGAWANEGSLRSGSGRWQPLFNACATALLRAQGPSDPAAAAGACLAVLRAQLLCGSQPLPDTFRALVGGLASLGGQSAGAGWLAGSLRRGYDDAWAVLGAAAADGFADRAAGGAPALSGGPLLANEAVGSAAADAVARLAEGGAWADSPVDAAAAVASLLVDAGVPARGARAALQGILVSAAAAAGDGRSVALLGALADRGVVSAVGLGSPLPRLSALCPGVRFLDLRGCTQLQAGLLLDREVRRAGARADLHVVVGRSGLAGAAVDARLAELGLASDVRSSASRVVRKGALRAWARA